ncbi:MAG: ATP-binding cassette domain-containing protein [Pseudomonadota bacterium]
MITLLDVSFALPERDPPEILFDSVSAHFGPFERVGILALPGSGKTVLARLLTGILPPDSGQVLHEGKVSWPMGFAGAMHTELTVRENLSILCRATGQDVLETTLICATLGGLERQLDHQLKALRPKDRRALAFCLSLASINDMYIADEALIFGEGAQKSAAEQLLEERLEVAGLILISQNVKLLKKHCDRFLVLRERRLRACYDLDDAANDLLRRRN